MSEGKWSGCSLFGNILISTVPRAPRSLLRVVVLVFIPTSISSSSTCSRGLGLGLGLRVGNVMVLPGCGCTGADGGTSSVLGATASTTARNRCCPTVIEVVAHMVPENGEEEANAASVVGIQQQAAQEVQEAVGGLDHSPGVYLVSLVPRLKKILLPLMIEFFVLAEQSGCWSWNCWNFLLWGRRTRLVGWMVSIDSYWHCWGIGGWWGRPLLALLRDRNRHLTWPPGFAASWYSFLV